MDEPFVVGIDIGTTKVCTLVARVENERNLRILDSVQQRCGCRVLLALKGFAMFRVFPLIRR